VCPTLNHCCSSCHSRGHRAESKRCSQFNANLATFEYHGFVTANRTRDWGAANGFWPVICLAQLHHIAAHGGYARLLTLDRNDVRKLLKEGDDLHDTWVGAKPLSTQIATEEAFSKTRYNKDLSEAYVHHYAAGMEHTSRLRRPPQRVDKPKGDASQQWGKPAELRLQPCHQRANQTRRNQPASTAHSRKELSKMGKRARRRLHHRHSNLFGLLLLMTRRKYIFYERLTSLKKCSIMT
jgi:hypothetical protein